MSEIIFYSSAAAFSLFLLGYGITNILTPSKLKPFTFWLSPWYCIIFLIFSLTVFSLAGLPVKQIAFPLGLFLLITTIVSFIKNKSSFNFITKENLLIALFVAASIVLNLSPLIKRHKFLTAVSMGNNDIIVYAQVPDYLVNHSIIESFFTKVPLGVSNLLQDGYRWGPPLLSAFFQHLFRVDGYQFVYLFQAIMFALVIPLVYLLFKILYKPNLFGLLISLSVFSFNANLLYMLYHNFFGQVLFWGLELTLLILIYTYFNSSEDKTNRLTLYDYNIAVALSVLFISYHEGALFILFPLIVFLIIQFLIKRSAQNWLSLIKISLITGLTGSIVVARGIVFDYLQSFGSNPNQPIGWPPFRTNLPFANPFEATGLYSIHSFAPLPTIIALVLSMLVVGLLFFGLLKSKYRLLSLCYMTFAAIFLVFFFFARRDYWVYNRSLTYNLPLFLILFSIGITHMVKNNNLFKKYILFAVVALVLFSGVKLNKRFLNEHLAVDKSFISISQLDAKNTLSEPVYPESVLDDTIIYWRQIWSGYFLYKNFPIPSIPPVTNAFEKRIPDNGLVLLSKATPWFKPPQVLLKSVKWENEYYRLGRLCNSSECLSNRPEDLSGVVIGQSPFEDSLLISGWSTKESSNRWAIGKESTLRLVAKNNSYQTLSFEAQSLSQPQTVSVYFDGKLLGSKSVITEWQQYVFPIVNGISKGVHEIKFIYSNTYKPSQVLINNLDNRDLAVNYKWIKLE